MIAVENLIRKSVEKWEARLRKLALDIHAHPELGYEETQACAWQAELLRDMGFKVTLPYAGIRTAYKAVLGHGEPVLCIMAEYDALPGLGHGCGHNLIAMAAIGAGKALGDALIRTKKAGTIV